MRIFRQAMDQWSHQEASGPEKTRIQAWLYPSLDILQETRVPTPSSRQRIYLPPPNSSTWYTTAKQLSGYKPKDSTISISKLSHLLGEKLVSTIDSHSAGIAARYQHWTASSYLLSCPPRRPHHRSPLNGHPQNNNPRTEGNPDPLLGQTKANLCYFHPEPGQ